MPFSQVNESTKFSSSMGKVLAKLSFATAYLDDIIIWSRTQEEHLLHLQAVFDCLREAGLKLIP